jgi:EAL domain-containing protein (putative c-di-GMP-specific phosphodiesterase class I)
VDGVLSPTVFIPIAESSGFIPELGEWVVREACRQAQLWRQARLEFGRIAVNVSALQFRDPVALERILDTALSEVGLAPDRLELEITESAFMDVTREHRNLLRRLRGRGISIAIDDFGTGYSSLAYLRRLPADRIKIAQEFVQQIAGNGADATITRTAVLLGQGLGLQVVAEGVETAEQLAILKLWGCEEAQGYLFARPMPPEELDRVLRGGRTS